MKKKKKKKKEEEEEVTVPVSERLHLLKEDRYEFLK
jgi:hypothetical protein